MPPVAVLMLRILILAEPAFAVAALAAYVRPGRGSSLPAMRDYLIARLVICTIDLGTVAGPRSIFPAPAAWTPQYFAAWWCSSLVLAFLLFRVAGQVLQVMLRPLAGLRALSTVVWRWLLVASLLLLVPAAISATVARLRHGHPFNVLGLAAALAFAQLLPLALVFVVGFRLRMSVQSRMFGILAGLAVEPAANFLSVWFYSHSLWPWGNLLRQAAATATLVIWTVWFLLPVGTTRFPALQGVLLRLDTVALAVLRSRKGAQPLVTAPAPGSARLQAEQTWYGPSKRPDSRESGPA
jgi:hypothetical protein